LLHPDAAFGGAIRGSDAKAQFDEQFFCGFIPKILELL
jgi:hypothetical protein